MAEANAGRHGFRAPLEAFGFKTIPYITGRMQAIQLPFDQSLRPASRRAFPSYRFEAAKGLTSPSTNSQNPALCALASSSVRDIRAYSGSFRALPYTVTLTGKNSHTIQPVKLDFRPLLVPTLASFLFILLSIGLIPYAGIQEDEALFATPFFWTVAREYRLGLFHHKLPIMVMSYVGALKTWIYWPLVAWLGSNIWVVRLPVALAGAVTVFIFYHLIRNSGSPRPVLASVAGALMLATDPVFLLGR